MLTSQICNIAIFASGNGTNAEKVMKSAQDSSWGKVRILITDNIYAGAISRAKNHNVEVHIIPRSKVKDGVFLSNLLENEGIDMVVLAGYLKMIPKETVATFRNRIINIHPSLLPKYGGKGMFGSRVHEKVLENQEPKSGITIHYVNEEYDKGDIIFQKEFDILPNWSINQLVKKIQETEHEFFPRIVQRIARQIVNKTLNKEPLKDHLAPKTALISVFEKSGLEELVRKLDSQQVKILSTGGTANFIRKLGIEVEDVSEVTGYPSVLGGRVKTLHPRIFGGILYRRNEEQDLQEIEKHFIPPIDLVVVDLYPFEETLAKGGTDSEIIEKIDIGGISLIRAAAKNFQDVVVISSRDQYSEFLRRYEGGNHALSMEDRRYFAGKAFETSSHYDVNIHAWMAPNPDSFGVSQKKKMVLRYGENPHQKAHFYGTLDEIFEKLGGKPLSYNNLVDTDGALQALSEFSDPCVVIVKHTNPCGLATGIDINQAWDRALACDPISAFGGIIACNREVGEELAHKISELFFEVLVAPSYSDEAQKILLKKKKRVILKLNKDFVPRMSYRSLLGGVLEQEVDQKMVPSSEMELMSSRKPSPSELKDAEFGERAVKHLKSNAIAIVKDGQLIGSGIGQTSRIDALKQAIHKAKSLGFDLKGSVLCSDAFFPFDDCATLSFENGIEHIVQPGGSLRDKDTIKFCESHNMCLLFTGVRHFRH